MHRGVVTQRSAKVETGSTLVLQLNRLGYLATSADCTFIYANEWLQFLTEAHQQDIVSQERVFKITQMNKKQGKSETKSEYCHLRHSFSLSVCACVRDPLCLSSIQMGPVVTLSQKSVLLYFF